MSNLSAPYLHDEEAARELGVRLDEEKLKGALRRMKDQPPQEDDGSDDAKRKKHQ